MVHELSIEIRKRFSAEAVIEAAMRLDFEAAPVTALFGPSGAGKTTVLRCLAGLERPDEGTIQYGDEVWFDAASGVFVPPQRRKIGYLFQDYALFPHLTVETNIAYGLRSAPRHERERRITDLLRLLHIDALRKRYPEQISGGERQRVALARAVAPRPRLLLLDEPLSALDTPARERLRVELRRSLEELGTPAIIVTHDRTEALALADCLVVMTGGRTRQSGPAQEVFLRPADLEVAHSVGAETIIPARLVETQDGVAVFRAGVALIRMAAPEEIAGSQGFLCIRAEDVTLTRRHEPESSDRNSVPATVVSVVREGVLVRVVLDAGFPLVALVARQAFTELELNEGDDIRAVFRAASVHFIARPDH